MKRLSGKFEKLAAEHLISELTTGKTLSKLLIKFITNRSSKFYLISNGNQINENFAEGFAPTSENKRSGDLISEAAEVLNSAGHSAMLNIVGEHRIALKGDPWLKSIIVPQAFYKEEVYFFNECEPIDRPFIYCVIDELSTAVGFSLFLISCKLQLTDTDEIANMPEVERAVRILVTGAFDNEALLLCDFDGTLDEYEASLD